MQPTKSDCGTMACSMEGFGEPGRPHLLQQFLMTDPFEDRQNFGLSVNYQSKLASSGQVSALKGKSIL